MTNIKFSIIIPVYNTSYKDLSSCLSSILMQTVVKECEIIIIDDYSTLSYDFLLKQYKELLNIKYIKLNENHGASYARNIGINLAKGENILFCDSDDTYSLPISIETMYDGLYSDEYDFASYGFIQEMENGEIYSGNCNLTWLWCKIYKKSFLDTYNIRFNENTRYNEDVGFNQKCFAFAKNIFNSNKTIYFWRYNINSTCRDKNSEYNINGMNDFVLNYIDSFKFIKNNHELDLETQWQFVDGFIIIYYFYIEMLNRKPKEYCDNYYELLKEYYNLIFDFAHILICDDDFNNHYLKIHSTHNIYNKGMIPTLDWYTFINNCEFERRKKFNISNNDFN